MRHRRMNSSSSGEILVRVVAPKRGGKFVLKWTNHAGEQKQLTTRYEAKRTFKRLALKQAEELQTQLNLARQQGEVDWHDFVILYTRDHLSGLALKTRKSWATAESRFRELVKPQELSAITTATLGEFAAKLRASGVVETTTDTYLRTISGALRKAEEYQLIERAPKFKRPRRAKGVTKRARGRAPTTEEIERMMAAAVRLRNKSAGDGDAFSELIHKLSLSGLRITEAISMLSWEWNAPISVMVDGRYVMLKMLAEGHKSHEDCVLPVAPDFGEWLRSVPDHQRRGKVFKLGLAVSTVEKQIARFGKAAGVVVSERGKTATAQDLRRAFGTRWAMRVKPVVLQKLMRHESIETTMQYYVHLEAENVARELETASGGAYGGASALGGTAEESKRVAKELEVADE